MTGIKRDVRVVFVDYVFDNKTKKDKDDIGNVFIHLRRIN